MCYLPKGGPLLFSAINGETDKYNVTSFMGVKNN